MPLKQPNSAAVWTEPKDSGAATAITPMSIVDNGAGYYVLAASGVVAARLLDNGAGYYATHDGPDNPGGAAELRLIDVGAVILTHE